MIESVQESARLVIIEHDLPGLCRGSHRQPIVNQVLRDNLASSQSDDRRLGGSLFLVYVGKCSALHQRP
jgi:hypothetical protein